MRVSTKYASDPTSCMTGEDAEVEDYTIEVIDATASLITIFLRVLIYILIHPMGILTCSLMQNQLRV